MNEEFKSAVDYDGDLTGKTLRISKDPDIREALLNYSRLPEGKYKCVQDIQDPDEIRASVEETAQLFKRLVRVKLPNSDKIRQMPASNFAAPEV